MGLNRRDRIGQYIGSSTSGSILFINSSNQLAQDNTNIFWDDTNNRLGIGTSSPATTLDVRGRFYVDRTINPTISNTNLSHFSIGNYFADGGVNYGEVVVGITTGGQPYMQSFNGQMLRVNPQGNAVLVGGKLGVGVSTTPTAQFDLTASSSSTIGQIIKGAAAHSVNFWELQDSSGNVQLCIDSNYALACTATSTTQQIQARSRTGMGGVGGDFTFEIKRDGSNNSGNGSFLKLTDNNVSSYLKWIANGFVQGVLDFEIWHSNGKVYAAPSTGGNYFYNPVTNTTDLSILRIPVQNMTPGGGTSSPQGAFRVSACTTGATSPVSIADVAMLWIEGAPTQGANMTITKRMAALFQTGDAGGIAQVQRAFTAQTANLSEWQDVSLNVLTSIDSAGRINLHAQNEIRFQDSTGGQYAGFKAPATIGSSHTYTLPTGFGSPGQFLTDTDGAGTLDWDTPAGGATPSMARHFAFMGA